MGSPRRVILYDSSLSQTTRSRCKNLGVFLDGASIGSFRFQSLRRSSGCDFALLLAAANLPLRRRLDADRPNGRRQSPRPLQERRPFVLIRGRGEKTTKKEKS